MDPLSVTIECFPAVAQILNTSALPVFQTRWTCEICEVTVSSELTLESHLRGKKHRAKAKLWCALCNLRVSSEIDMIAHLKGKRHLTKLLETSISKPVIPAAAKLPDTSSALPAFQRRWTCEICEVTVSSELTLESHLRGKKHRAKAKLWCAFCNLRVSSEIDMIAHLKGKRHLTKLLETSISKPVIPAPAKLPDTSSALPAFQTRWTCEICEVTVSSELILESHLRGKKHRAKAKLWCAFCNLRVSSEIDMIAHLKGKRHLTKLLETSISKPVIPAPAKLPDTSSALPAFQTRWTCEICEVTVSSELILESHLRGKKHRAKAKLWCAFCNLRVSSEIDMIAHLKGKRHLTKLLETSISKPVISAAAKLPDTSSALPAFQRRWTCEICEVTVSSELILESHLRGKKHRAKAKLWCAFCNLRVSSEIDMIAHLKGRGT